jgi:hypothetical protein
MIEEAVTGWRIISELELLGRVRRAEQQRGHPMTPLIGVRISWLMLARNPDLMRVAFSSSWLSDRSVAADRQLALARGGRGRWRHVAPDSGTPSKCSRTRATSSTLRAA